MARILLAEHESPVAAELVSMLVAGGHDVLETAVSMSELSRRVASDRPDLLLVSSRLPDLEGAAPALRALGIPVVLLVRPSDMALVSTSLGVGYLLEPFSYTDLQLAIERVVSSRGSEAFDGEPRASLDPVICVDLEQRIVGMTPSAEQLVAVTAAEAIGKLAHEVLVLERESTGKTIENPIGRALATGLVVGADSAMLLVRPDGSKVPCALAASAVTDPKGDVTGACLLLRDVRDRRRIMAHLVMSERLPALAVTPAGVAHEMSNPLAFLMTNQRFAIAELGALRDATRLDAPQLARLDAVEEALREAVLGAERIEEAVRGIRLQSSQGAEPAPVSMADVVDAAAGLAWNELRHRAQLVQSLASVPEVWARELDLVRVVTSLVSNAVQATQDQSSESNNVRVTLFTDERGWVVTEIADTGCGMAPEVMLRAFDPFFTTRPPGFGLGLGLCLARFLTEANGGELGLASLPGKGSIARLSFPPHRAHQEDPVLQAAPPALHVCANVLLIDDEPLVARSIERILRQSHSVTMVENAANALAILERNPQPDVILCDLMMPTMTGIELFSVIKERWPHLTERVIFMTGGVFTPAARAFVESHPGLVLEKPCRSEQLLEVIAQLAA